MDPQPTDPVPEDSWAYSSKRKREAPQAPNPYIPFTQEQLEKKFHHLQKTLVAGAKKAQTFETQRLIKKIAQLKKKNDDSSSPEILDLSTQLTELKTVPLAPLTLLSLHTRLTKQKTLTTHPILALVVLAPPPPHDELKSKPANRILSSKTFAKEITDAVKTVRLWMDPEEREKEKEKVKEEKRVERRGPTVERNVLGGPPRGLASASTSTVTAPRVQEENAEDEQEPLDERGNEDLYFEPGDGASSSGSDNENDEDEGNSSDDDGASQASWSSGSISSSTAAAPPAKKSKPPPAPTDPKAKKKKISTSTFLPSLSSGFIAGSDSEPEDLSDEGGERKNRRGQRARKAIWEKKYGAAANHLKARTAQFTEATRGRDSFLASRGGSTHADAGYPSHSPSNTNPYPRGQSSSRGDRGGRGGARGGRGGRGGYGGGGDERPEYVPGMGPPPKTYKSSNFPGGREAAAAGAGGFGGGRGGGAAGGGGGGGVPKKKPEESFAGMHPSWIAKQKQKEKEAAMGMGAGGAPKGKKVVFD